MEKIPCSRWTRWQDWVALAAGAYAALGTNLDQDRPTPRPGPWWSWVSSPWWRCPCGRWTMPERPDLGVRPHAILGVLFFISPWVMQFTDLKSMSYTAWAVGVITFVVGMWATPREVQHRLHHASPRPLTADAPGRLPHGQRARRAAGAGNLVNPLSRTEETKSRRCMTTDVAASSTPPRGCSPRHGFDATADRPRSPTPARGPEGADLLLLPTQDRPAAHAPARNGSPDAPGCVTCDEVWRPPKATPPGHCFGMGRPDRAWANTGPWCCDTSSSARAAPTPRSGSTCAACGRPSWVSPRRSWIARSLGTSNPDCFSRPPTPLSPFMLDRANATRIGGAPPDLDGAARVIALALQPASWPPRS